jgi:PAS domain S-box-containing protein
MKALLAGRFIHTREMLTDALHFDGWTVECVDELQHAPAQLGSRAADLFLIDASADETAAVALCRTIRGAGSGLSAYVLAAARQFRESAVSTLLSAGADDVLILPCTASDLRLRLQLATHRVRESVPSWRHRYRKDLEVLRDAMDTQRAFLEELFDSAPEGILLLDDQDRILRLNTEFSRMFGYTEADSVGTPVNDLIAPADLLDEAERIAERVHSGERLLVETVRKHKDGSLLHVSLLATPVRVASGQLGVYAIYRDITERKRAEESLRRSEARYHALFRQAPVGVLVYDGELTVLDCNTSLLRILKIGREHVIGRDLSTLRDQRVLPSIRIGGEGRPSTYVGPYRPRSSDADMWLSVRSAPLHDEHGSVLGGIAVIEDISNRVQAEIRLRSQAEELRRINEELRERTHEAEAALRLRNRLYTTMNHELRTPISAVMLYNELLLDGAMGSLTPEQADAIRNSQRAAEHLLDLVRDVLDLAKLDAGKAAVQLQHVRLTELLAEIRATADPLASRYGSELRIETTGAGDADVLTDARRLRQIVLNLLSNAMKFGAGKPITLHCDVGDELRLTVSDQGVGIAAHHLKTIFEEFVQVGVVQDGGSGLGLAISQRLAHLLGGRLEVESEPDIGSTFRLILPRPALETQQTAAPAETSYATHSDD